MKLKKILEATTTDSIDLYMFNFISEPVFDEDSEDDSPEDWSTKVKKNGSNHPNKNANQNLKKSVGTQKFQHPDKPLDDHHRSKIFKIQKNKSKTSVKAKKGKSKHEDI